MKSSTAKACEMLKNGGMPITRTNRGVASYTRKWKARLSFYRPPKLRGA